MDGMGETVYVSLGSNMGSKLISQSEDRAGQLRDAVDRLRAAGEVLAVSSLYETAPVGVADQPWFLNCVVAMATVLTPEQFLRLALRIERAMGRVRTRDKGPRIIDIDLILFGDRVLDEPGLRIPHPAMQERRFVLEPLAEIAPLALHPLLNKTATGLLAEIPPGQEVRKL